MTGIFQALINAGFDVNKTGDFTHEIKPNLNLTITRGEDLSHYYIKIQPTGRSLLVTAHVRELNNVENQSLRSYSMSTHDDLSLYFGNVIDLDAAQATLDEITFVRQTALDLLASLKAIESDLIAACKEATKVVREKEEKRAALNEQKRLARIEAFKSGKVKRGEKLAKEIMLSMETETEKEKNTARISLELLVNSGRPQTRILETVWEKGRVSWKRKGNLIDPDEALRLISAEWIPE